MVPVVQTVKDVIRMVLTVYNVMTNSKELELQMSKLVKQVVVLMENTGIIL